MGYDNREYENNKRPRVSVITIFFNGEAFLAEAIESVIAQSFNDWELLLVDDGSGPAATAIAKEYSARHPEKIRYHEHPSHVNRGMSATRNLGIRHARGEYIAFIDADDVWSPSKLSHQLAVLDAHPEVGMVCGAVTYWNSWSAGRDVSRQTGHRQDVVVHPPEATLALYPLGTALAPCPSDVVVRANILRALGGFEEHFTGINQMYEDQAFFAKVYLSVAVYFCSKTSLKYREHPNSCVSAVKRAGMYEPVREYFLRWLEVYLKTCDKVDPNILASLRKAQRYYRSPRIHYLLAMPRRIINLSMRVTRHIVGGFPEKFQR
jgi:glycosyltransferase involved in cell wall biosynthesis